MCAIWERKHNPDKTVHVLILKCIKASVAMETVLNDNKHAYALQGVAMASLHRDSSRLKRTYASIEFRFKFIFK